MKRIFLTLFTLVFSTYCMALDLTLPSIFADHMVLQQGQKVPVWGTTGPNAVVEVTFAGQTKKAKADDKGNWSVNLDVLKASSESRILTISSKGNNDNAQVVISDVLVGEVWLCGGQSNMYRPFRMLTGEAFESKYEPTAELLRKEDKTANDPLFRQYRVGIEFSVLEEKNQGKGTWSKAIQGQVNEFSGTAYFFGKELRRELNVPVAIISCNLGATQIEPWMPVGAFNSDPSLQSQYDEKMDTYKKDVANWNDTKETEKYNQLLKDWEMQVIQAKAKGEKEPEKPRKTDEPNRDKQVPSTLFNAMVHPLIPFAMKGAIWYQGESNTSKSPETYGIKLNSMINSWRSAWGQGDFYFYACQLANYRSPNEQPVDDGDGWAVLSNSQREIFKLPNTGLAVLNDIGEAKDIHPKNKFDTGKRLSFWALKQAYNKDIVCSGPLYKSSKIKGNKVSIEFDYVGSGLMVGNKHLTEPTVEVNEPLNRFQICGKDGKWKWAEAKIVGKNKVEVWNQTIENPIEVRYAWSSNPEGANLYNKEGLPASLFKTK